MLPTLFYNWNKILSTLFFNQREYHIKIIGTTIRVPLFVTKYWGVVFIIAEESDVPLVGKTWGINKSVQY
jgi:hypothetical protein